MKYILIGIIIVLTSCSSKKSSYILTPLESQKKFNINTQIGVKKIVLPDYLNSDKILIKEGNKIEELETNFASMADTIFTQNMISSLKNTLNDPNIFLYPWDIQEKKGFIIEINIDDYLYNNGFVYLRGSYFIKNTKNNKNIIAKNFNFKRISNKNTDDIIKNLNKLFNSLIYEIALKIPK